MVSMEGRSITVEGMIDDDAVARMMEMMLHLQQRDPGAPIRLVLNSAGGSVRAVFTVIQFFHTLSPPIQTHCAKLALGGAALILGCGSKGWRTAGAKAMIGLSPITGGSDAPEDADALAKTRERVAGIVAAVTGQKDARVAAALSKLTMMWPEEAREFGLIDHVIPEG
jgi:ATP-dependent Clp protease, protease subunit